MDYRICLSWVGYLLLNPLRKLLENPHKILNRFIQEGMTVLETGCGMGYFTLPMARMVGPRGRVVAVDIQPKMLSALNERAQKAGLLERIEIRQAGTEWLGVEDFSGKVDFAAALHMVHEVPDPVCFFTQIWKALKPGGQLLVVEPKGHVSQNRLEQTVSVAEKVGFRPERLFRNLAGRGVLLAKPSI